MPKSSSKTTPWLKRLAGYRPSGAVLAGAIIILVLGALLGSALFAADFPRDLTLSWTNPSQYEDGTAIAPGELRGIRADCTRQSGDVVLATEYPNTEPGLDYTQTETGAIDRAGTYTCLLVAITLDGTESDASDPASIKLTGKPLPPVNVRVEVPGGE